MWPLYCVQRLLQGPQMAVAVLSLGCVPPNGGLVGGLLCDDVSLTAPAICQSIKARLWLLSFSPLTRESRHGESGGGVPGRAKSVVCAREEYLYREYEKGQGWALYCSSISKTLERWWKLGSSAKHRESAGESCWCLNPHCSFPDILHIHSCLVLSHCVNSSDVLSSLLPWARCTETHQTSFRSAHCQKGILTPVGFFLHICWSVTNSQSKLNDKRWR